MISFDVMIGDLYVVNMHWIHWACFPGKSLKNQLSNLEFFPQTAQAREQSVAS